MEHIISSRDLQGIHQNAGATVEKENFRLLEKFMVWCNEQEENRLLWLAIALLGNIGVILPLTLSAVLLGSGNNFLLWIITLVVNVPVLALNLAAQPTKVTLPVLFFSWFMNALVILFSLMIFLMA